MLRYLDDLDAAHDNDIITVVLSDFVLDKWWEQLLQNQSALVLKTRLLFRRNTVVTSVPFTPLRPHPRLQHLEAGQHGDGRGQ